jgi:hypothetical protein
MCLKLQKRVYYILRQGPPIMLALKYGKISLMIVRVIYGAWDAYFMRSPLFSLLLEQVIWMVYTKKY